MNVFPQEKAICLTQLAARIPEAMRLARSDAAGSDLGSYSRSMRRPPRAPAEKAPPPLQDGEDLAALAASEAARLLGKGSARALTRTLEDDFCALTANHHGADFHPEFVQGTLIFSLPLLDSAEKAVPVLACGGVPKHNAGYPRGILLGRGEGTKPRRFPVLPDRNRRMLVSVSPPFQARDVERALTALNPLRPERGDGLRPWEARAVRTVLEKVFAAPRVLAQDCYRDQATIMNSLLWPLMFAPDIRPPRMVSLDMQFLSGRLAAADLASSRSLLRALCLEPECVLALWRELDGTRGCWTRGDGIFPVRGTFLFWALDDMGRPLAMAPDPRGRLLLAAGRPDRNVKLSADDLASALRERRIFPGLYLYFAVASLARGLVCCGGVYQTGYLTAMRQGTARALHACGESAMACRVDAAPDSPLSTGFLPIRIPAETARPASHAASPVDILARGGLDSGLLEGLAAMGADEAFAAALSYQYEDLVPEAERAPDWEERLSCPCGLMLPPPGDRGATCPAGEASPDPD